MTTEPWEPNVTAPIKADLRRAEAKLEAAIRRGFKPLLDFMLRNWERESPVAAEAATENLEGLPQALYFAIRDDEWERFAVGMAREVVEGLSVALEMGAEAGRGDLPGIVVNWSLDNPAARQWMRQWSLDLVKGLLQTTKDRMRETLSSGLGLGESRDELAARIRLVAQDVPEWRARLIAQSETVRAYNQGHLQLYKASGVVERLRWLDGQPNACPLCEALDRQEVELGELFKGGVDAPPLHPGCRCDSRGIVMGAPR